MLPRLVFAGPIVAGAPVVVFGRATSSPPPPQAASSKPLSATSAAGISSLVRTMAASPSRDLAARGRQHEPGCAERRRPLAVDLSAALVACEQIQRVAAVAHLQAAVVALDRAQLRSLGAAAGGRPAVCDQRRPGGRAPSTAGALRAGVLLEEVEAAALAVDEDRAEAGRADAHGGLGGGRGLDGRHRLRAGALVVVAAAATGGGEHANRHDRGA